MKKIVIPAVIALVFMLLFGLTTCGSSSSSYDLHDKNGNINWNYVNDMNDYFNKHPEKRP